MSPLSDARLVCLAPPHAVLRHGNTSVPTRIHACLVGDLGKDRQQERLGLARPGPCGHDNVPLAFHKPFERLPLVLVQGSVREQWSGNLSEATPFRTQCRGSLAKRLARGAIQRSRFQKWRLAERSFEVEQIVALLLKRSRSQGKCTANVQFVQRIHARCRANQIIH